MTELSGTRYSRRGWRPGRIVPGADPAPGPAAPSDPVEGAREPAPAPAKTGGTLRRAAETAETARVHPFMIAFFAAVILPVELTLKAGPINLTPFKAIMAVIAIPVLVQFFSRCRFTWLDGMFFAYALYTIMAVMLKRGVAATDTVGLFFLETVVVYAVTRLTISSVEDYKATIRFFIGIMLILSILAIPEALTFNRFLHEIPSKLTGILNPQQNDVRFGMLRASTTFSHQILFGIAAASLTIYAWVFAKSTWRRVRDVGGLTVGTFFSLSSAAWLLLVMQFGLIAAERATRMIPKRGLVIILAFLGVFIFLELASNRGPFVILSNYLTLNTQSSYFRILIFENAIDDVWRHPIIGINPSEWTRPDWMPVSIDNHWLLLALRGGIPSFIFITIFIIATCYKVANMPYPGPPPAEVAEPSKGRAGGRSRAEEWDPMKPTFDIRNGYIITTISLVLGGATVAYYGAMFPILSFFFALGPTLLAMIDEETGPCARAAAPARREKRG